MEVNKTKFFISGEYKRGIMDEITLSTFMNPLLIFTLVCLVAGILMIASPSLPDSEVTQEKNNTAFLALTAVGSILIVLSVWLGYKYVHGNMDWINDYFRDRELKRQGINIMGGTGAWGPDDY